MSILGRKVPVKVVVGMVLVMLLVALLPVLSSTPSREIVLVVKGMAFHLEGDPLNANPTLEVRAGERVRVTVRNEDRGLTHDFAVPVLGVELSPMSWNQSGEVMFDVPDKPGTYEYVCRPHQLMMRGTIRVH